jgi:hypothetical protein
MPGIGLPWGRAVEGQLGLGPSAIVHHADAARPSIPLLPKLGDGELLQPPLTPIINLRAEEHAKVLVDPGSDNGRAIGPSRAALQDLTPPSVAELPAPKALVRPMEEFHAKFAKREISVSQGFQSLRFGDRGGRGRGGRGGGFGGGRSRLLPLVSGCSVEAVVDGPDLETGFRTGPTHAVFHRPSNRPGTRDDDHRNLGSSMSSPDLEHRVIGGWGLGHDRSQPQGEVLPGLLGSSACLLGLRRSACGPIQQPQQQGGEVQDPDHPPPGSPRSGMPSGRRLWTLGGHRIRRWGISPRRPLTTRPGTERGAGPTWVPGHPQPDPDAQWFGCRRNRDLRRSPKVTSTTPKAAGCCQSM